MMRTVLPPPERIRPLMLDAPMALWLVEADSAPADAALCWLGADEIARAARFRSAAHRVRYLAAHVALRRIIAQHCSIAPERQRFEQGAFGKRRLAGAPGCQFSLSYAGDVALIGVTADGAIGVDLEADRVIEDADDLAALHFDPAERARHQELSGDGANAAFLRGWTRKEACLKAIGVGLSLPPATLHTGFDSVRRVAASGCSMDVGSFGLNGLIGAWAQVRASAQ